MGRHGLRRLGGVCLNGLRHWGGEGGRHGYGLAARWGDRGEGATDREGDGGGDTRLFTSFPRTAVFCIGTLHMLMLWGGGSTH